MHIYTMMHMRWFLYTYEMCINFMSFMIYLATLMCFAHTVKAFVLKTSYIKFEHEWTKQYN